MNLNRNTFYSYNSRFSISAKQFFIPSWSQVFLYTLISSLILVLINGQAIWEKFIANFQSQAKFSDVFVGNTPTTQKFIDQLSHSRLPQIIFWALVGCAIYILIWFAQNIITNLRNDVVADAYLHPSGYNRRLFWESILSRKIFLYFCVIVLIAYTLVGIKFLSAIAKLFYSAIDGFRLFPSLVEIAGSIFVISFLLYLFLLLTHLTINLWQLVYRDL